MSSEAPVTVHDRGQKYAVHVDVVNDCVIRIVCLDQSGAVSTIPPMTPFEAGMVAQAINRAAERADARQ